MIKIFSKYTGGSIYFRIMTACIFGASGLVGSQLMFICLHEERIREVKIFVRKPLAYKHEKLKQVICNFYDAEKWSSELKDAYVFCSIGTTIRTAGSKEKFTAVDRDIPARIAEEAEKQGVKHFVYVSSVGADQRSSNFYLRSKGETEELLKKKFKGPLTIVRPSMLLGKRLEFRLGEIIGKYMMMGIDAITFGLLGKYRPVKAVDVARAMLVSSMNASPPALLQGRSLRKAADSY